ncbi:hypothetical protein PSPO_b1630 [Pseudoalteromonas spongiae UST010723-006]|nr:hypothetical protein PSPO_b1630 [Pseudoalteromonas spongiae UST010723-006]
MYLNNGEQIKAPVITEISAIPIFNVHSLKLNSVDNTW